MTRRRCHLAPYDPEKPAITSGIRLGTPTATTEGMKEEQMRQIARLIDTALIHPDDEEVLERVRAQVHELTQSFPVYEDFELPD